MVVHARKFLCLGIAGGATLPTTRPHLGPVNFFCGCFSERSDPAGQVSNQFHFYPYPPALKVIGGDQLRELHEGRQSTRVKIVEDLIDYGSHLETGVGLLYDKFLE